MNAAMRARWEREDDDALLTAHYYRGDLTPEGHAVVLDVLRTRLGGIDEIERRAWESQGAILGRITASRLTSGPAGGPLPAMRGVVVFAEGGVGFVPIARFHDSAGGFAEAGAHVGRAVGGGLAGFLVGSVIDGALNTSHRVVDRTRAKIPLSILARIDRNAIWIPAQPSGEVTWGGLSGEVTRAGQRCFECDVESDITPAVLAWAELVEWRARSTDASASTEDAASLPTARVVPRRPRGKSE